MTEEERKALVQEYLNTCARYGELMLSQELATKEIEEARGKAKGLLKKLKDNPVETKNE